MAFGGIINKEITNNIDENIAQLGNQYIWNKYSWNYSQKGDADTRVIYGSTNSSETKTIFYGSSPLNLLLGVYEGTILITYDNYNSLNITKGKYISDTTDINRIYYVNENSQFSHRVQTISSPYVYIVEISNCEVYTNTLLNFEGYVNSLGKDTFPELGEQEGFGYKLLSRVGDSLVHIGNYIGSGTYGQNHPNTLTFDFVPKLVIVQGENISTSVSVISNFNFVGFIQGMSSSFNYPENVTFNGNTLNWYTSNNGAQCQFNVLNKIYTYIAFA